MNRKPLAIPCSPDPLESPCHGPCIELKDMGELKRHRLLAHYEEKYHGVKGRIGPVSSWSSPFNTYLRANTWNEWIKYGRGGA